MSKKSSAKSAKVAAPTPGSTRNPATEKARKQALAAIGARLENLNANPGTANGTAGTAASGGGAPSAPTALVPDATPAPAAGTQPAATTPATGGRSKKGGGKKAPAAKAPGAGAKAAKPAKKSGGKKANESKAAKPPKAPRNKKVSALDAAAQVLAKAKEPMRAQQLIDEMAARGLWKSPGGQTPAATLYAAVIREISAKGKESRFKKAERGLFAAGPGIKE